MVAGDTHGDAAWAATLTKTARDCGASLVIQVGDFGYWPRAKTTSSRSPRATFLERIAQACQEHRVDEWIVIDGNHDDHQELTRLVEDGTDPEGMVRLGTHVRYSPRGNRFERDGVKFGTLGGAVSLDAWAERNGHRFNGGRYRPGWDWFPDLEAPRPEDVDRLADGGQLDVLIAHEAPSQVNMRPYEGLRHINFTDQVMARNALVRDLVGEAVARTEAHLLVHGHWHHRVTTVVDYDGRPCVVEGLASNSSHTGRDGRAYLFLELGPQWPGGPPNARAFDGRDTDALPV